MCDQMANGPEGILQATGKEDVTNSQKCPGRRSIRPAWSCSNSHGHLAGIFQGTMGINGAGSALGDTSRTAMAPRRAPVSECVTSG